MAEITLNDGNKVPAIGLGTWKVTVAGEVEKAVHAALAAGYRHLDTAAAYGNEAEVGAAVNAALAEGIVTREQLYIVTKLWNTGHRPEDVLPSLRRSLSKLKLDYVDLYLIHWPTALQPGEENFPKDSNGNLIFVDINPTDTWKAMEKCVQEGLAKSIGLSNFNIEQIQDVLNNCTIPPAMLQVEVNPYFCNDELIEFCKSKGIAVTAYSPLGSLDRPWASPREPVLLDDPRLKALAQKLGRSVPQIILRWLIQRGLIVIPKSSNSERIKQNFQICDFELSKADMDTISSFDRGFPLVVPMVTGADGKRMFRDINAPHFPFKQFTEKMLASQAGQ